MKRLQRNRPGMTLLEVVLALAILAIAMALLSQLVSIGIRASKEARLLTQGQLLAESVITEIVAGSLAPQSGSVPNDPSWSYDAVLEPTAQNGVVRLVVNLRKANDEFATNISFARMMRDPNLAIPVEETTTEDSADTGLTGATSL